VRRLKNQIRIALLALAAALATAFGSWFLATDGKITEPAESPPLASKPVTTQKVAPDADAPEPKPVEETAVPDPASQAALEDKLRQAPEYQPFFARLRGLYPAEYDSALKHAASQGAVKQDNAADLFLTESVRLLRQNRGLSGAKAGGQALDHLFDLHLKVMRQLAASDAGLCVDFLNGAPADRFAAFTGANRALMADEAMAGLTAIDDGAHKKIDREAPTSQDFDDLEKLLLAKGLDKAAISLLLDGKTPDPPLTDAQACHNGLVYLEVLQSLPDLQRLRLYALALEVMAHE
jgi:hypothetical protein